MPKGFGLRVRDDISAGPASVRLRDFSYYYFELGFRICRLLNDENLLVILLMALCGERYTTLISRALSRSAISHPVIFCFLTFILLNDSWHGDVAEYCQQLTATELALFTAGRPCCSVNMHSFQLYS